MRDDVKAMLDKAAPVNSREVKDRPDPMKAELREAVVFRNAQNSDGQRDEALYQMALEADRETRPAFAEDGWGRVQCIAAIKDDQYRLQVIGNDTLPEPLRKAALFSLATARAQDAAVVILHTPEHQKEEQARVTQSLQSHLFREVDDVRKWAYVTLPPEGNFPPEHQPDERTLVEARYHAIRLMKDPDLLERIVRDETVSLYLRQVATEGVRDPKQAAGMVKDATLPQDVRMHIAGRIHHDGVRTSLATDASLPLVVRMEAATPLGDQGKKAFAESLLTEIKQGSQGQDAVTAISFITRMMCDPVEKEAISKRLIGTFLGEECLLSLPPSQCAVALNMVQDGAEREVLRGRVLQTLSERPEMCPPELYAQYEERLTDPQHYVPHPLRAPARLEGSTFAQRVEREEGRQRSPSLDSSESERSSPVRADLADEPRSPTHHQDRLAASADQPPALWTPCL